MNGEFRKKILEVVRKIPQGKTFTYKEIAELAGSPRAWRAAGNVLNKNFNPEIPCHRVIRSDGKIGGYNRGSEVKRRVLDSEKALG